MTEEDNEITALSKYVTNNLFIEQDEILLKDEISLLIGKLMFLLSKVSTVKARKLKRFLSGLTVVKD